MLPSLSLSHSLIVLLSFPANWTQMFARYKKRTYMVYVLHMGYIYSMVLRLLNNSRDSQFISNFTCLKTYYPIHKNKKIKKDILITLLLKRKVIE